MEPHERTAWESGVHKKIEGGGEGAFVFRELTRVDAVMYVEQLIGAQHYVLERQQRGPSQPTDRPVARGVGYTSLLMVTPIWPLAERFLTLKTRTKRKKNGQPKQYNAVGDVTSRQVLFFFSIWLNAKVSKLFWLVFVVTRGIRHWFRRQTPLFFKRYIIYIGLMNWWLRDNVVRQLSAINGRHALAENLNAYERKTLLVWYWDISPKSDSPKTNKQKKRDFIIKFNIIHQFRFPSTLLPR